MADEIQSLSIDEKEALDLGILNHFENDRPKEVFLKLHKMTDSKRQIILEDFDDVEQLLFNERNHLIRRILGSKMPRFDHQRWEVVVVLSETVSAYNNDNIKIITALNRVTGRNFKPITSKVDWQKVAQKANNILLARENYYEVMVFTKVENTILYLRSFLNTINDKSRLDEIYDKTEKALGEIQTGREQPYNKELFIRNLLPEFYPPAPLAPSVKEALLSWGFLPQSQIERLINNPDRFELNAIIYFGWQALLAIGFRWEQQDAKPTDFDLLIDDIREEYKLASKELDYLESLANQEIYEQDTRT